eukprot:RCo019874
MRRHPPATVKEATPDAVRNTLITLNSSGDDLLKLNEAWEWIRTRSNLKPISFDTLKEMFRVAAVKGHTDAMDIRNLTIATSQRFPGSLPNYERWMSIVRECNPGCEVELKHGVVRKNCLDVTLSGSGKQFRIHHPYLDAERDESASPAPSASRLSPLRREPPSLVTYSYIMESPVGLPDYLRRRGVSPPAKDTATAATAAASFSLSGGVSASSIMSPASPVTSGGAQEGREAGAGHSPSQLQSGMTPSGVRLRVVPFVGTKRRLASLQEKKTNALRAFRETHEGTGSEKLAHPFPFESKFRVTDRLSFKHDRRGFFEQEPYLGAPATYVPRTLVDPEGQPPFVTKFHRSNNLDLRKEQFATQGLVSAKTADSHPARAPPEAMTRGLPPFVTALSKRTKDQAFSTGEFFPRIGNEMHQWHHNDDDLSVEEVKRLTRRAARLGFRFVPMSHPSDPLSQSRVHHEQDWRGPMDRRAL